MIDSIECVVIGSGALGASTAWHLARAGRSVALIDQHALGSQTSPRAAGLSSQARGTDLMTALAKRAVRKIESFAKDTGEEPLVFYQPGALKIARNPEHVAQLAMERERGRRYETGLVELSPSEARDLNPFLETTGILGVNYCPSDIYLEPSQIPHGYARAAERLGAVMLPHTRVTGVRTHRRRCHGRAHRTWRHNLRCRGRCGRRLAARRRRANRRARARRADPPSVDDHPADPRCAAQPAHHARHRHERLYPPR